MRKSRRTRNSKKSKRNKRTTFRQRKGGFSIFGKTKISIDDYKTQFENYKTTRKTGNTMESDKILNKLMSVAVTPCEKTDSPNDTYLSCEAKKTQLYFTIMNYLGLLENSSKIEKKAYDYYTDKALSKAKNVDKSLSAKPRQELTDAASTEVVSE
jgi:hypothetical protein